MSNWIKTADRLPPDDIIVETKIDESGNVRNQQELKRSRNLWWVPDGKMYIYYSPTHWRYV